MNVNSLPCILSDLFETSFLGLLDGYISFTWTKNAAAFQLYVSSAYLCLIFKDVYATSPIFDILN